MSGDEVLRTLVEALRVVRVLASDAMQDATLAMEERQYAATLLEAATILEAHAEGWLIAHHEQGVDVEAYQIDWTPPPRPPSEN